MTILNGCFGREKTVHGQNRGSPTGRVQQDGLLLQQRIACKHGRSPAFWHSLHIFSLVHRHLPCTGWDVVGASHPFFLSPTSPHACLFGYLPLTMLLLRALNACNSFLLLILLGCRHLCPVCLSSFCFVSPLLTVLPLLVGAQLWSLVVSLILFVLLHAVFIFTMLLVFCLNFLYLLFSCSNVPLALLLPCYCYCYYKSGLKSSVHKASMLL
jgi:hypothetical protein